VAAGSLITPGKKFEARSFLVGSPAKKVREVTDRDLQMIEQSWRTYLELARSYR
jgi:carbonic anhydrase/acetyltransferase-like protein (isoleucine patch superfamily)